MANLNVTVQDGNNINVEVTPTPRQTIVLDRGVAGVGIESVSIVFQDPYYYLEFTYTNGTTELVQLPSIAAGVVSFNTRIGVVTLTSLDVTDALGYTPPEPDGTGATGTWAISVSGNAATVTNGVYTTGSYSDPAWLTALAGAKIVGNITGNSANVTGVINVINGGTGATSLTGYVKGNGTSAMNANATIPNTDITGLGTASTLNAGVALGVATLDAGGKVPTSQIPLQGDLNYQGTWNALTNTPTLASSVGTQGYYYVVDVAGTTNLNGITDWQIGDWAIYNGTVWQKVDNTDAVTSVNGYTGTVVLSASDVGAPTTAGSGATGTWNISVSGNAATVTNGVYTTDTGTVTNTMLAGSIANNKLVNSAITINGTSTSLGGSINVGTVTSVSGTAPIASTGGTTPSLSISQSSASTDGYLSSTDWNTFNSKTSNTGTVTSVAASAGTGISVTGSPITTSGTLTITNTAPDQVVSLTEGGTTTITGTYPNFTISSADQFDGTVTSVAASAGTGISVSGSPITSSGTLTITNTAPDQVVSLTGAGTTDVTGTYPNFTITSNDEFDGTVTSVGGTGSVNGITLTGTVTSSGNLTLGGTLSGVSLTTQVSGVLPIANGGTNATTAPNARTNLGLGTVAVLDAAVALGAATLDAGGTVPLSQIPASIQGGLIYQGTWNASTNTPTLTSSVGTKGHYYAVSVAGSTNLNGITDWNIGDLAVYNGTAWEQIDNTDAVTSVNGFTGTVVLDAADVGAVETITSSDGSIVVSATGTTVDLTVSTDSPASTLLGQVRNETGATLTKGTVIYISGASGNKALVSKAIATSDATSAQTYGVITADISNNQNGYATLIGSLTNLNTIAFAEGAQLYLSSTVAGAYTSVKQYAPAHLVYVGVVTRSHATQGSIEVKIQNGYEMDELHNVYAQTPSNGNVLIWNNTTQLWEAAGITAGTGVSVTNGAGSITVANTGVTSLTASTGISVSGSTGSVAVTNTAPDQVVSLTGAGTTTISGTYPNFTITSADQYAGTVTSVAATVPSFLSVTGSPITSSGTLAIDYSGTALPVANGGTGATTLTGYVKGTGTSALTASSTIPSTDITGLGTMSTQNANSVAITGGAIDGTTIGATTASTVKATTLTTTGTGSPTDGTGQVYLNGSTSNRVEWAAVGTGAPAFSTRSAGTKALFYPAISGSQVDYAMGIDSATLWSSVPVASSSFYFKWYGGQTQVASLDGTGAFTSTSLTDSGNLTFTGTGNRITGDFSSSTIANRVAFQTSTTNGSTVIQVLPNGTATLSSISLEGDPALTNGSFFAVTVGAGSNTEARLASSIRGTGTYLPMTFYTGGSERVRISTTGAVGVGVSPSAWGGGFANSLQVGTAVVNTWTDSRGSFGANYYIDSSNAARYITTAAATQLLQTSGEFRFLNVASGTAGDVITFSEQMRLTSTGLGIGTSSPGLKLDVVGAIRSTVSGGTPIIYFNNGTTQHSISNSSGAMPFAIDGVEKMRLDSSGNLGLGVTPSAWSGGFKAMQYPGGSIASYASGTNLQIELGNAYYQSSLGGYAYYNTGTAPTIYRQIAGSHLWYTAPSGTAGNAISFTQAMTLTAAGNLGIGVTSPAYPLTVKNAAETQQFIISPASGVTFIGNQAADTAISFLYGNAKEAMRIDSSGNLGIGTSSPGVKLDVNGVGRIGNGALAPYFGTGGAFANEAEVYSVNTNPLNIGTGGAAPLRFWTNSTEKMRITSGGEVYIAGTTDQGAYNLQVNGTGVWGAGAYVNGSDARIKENVASIRSGLDIVEKLNPVTYRYKEDWSKDQSVQTGFIAQELLTALDGEVYVDGVVQQGGEYMSVAYQNLIPVLTKAIQEQQALITDLQTRLTALEGN